MYNKRFDIFDFLKEIILGKPALAYKKRKKKVTYAIGYFKKRMTKIIFYSSSKTSDYIIMYRKLYTT